jgi:O-antigen/teichoic acid export membrane protein
MSGPSPKKALLALVAAGGFQVGATLIGLIAYTLIARTLPADGLGAWTLLGTLSFLISLVDLGFTTAVQRAAVTPDHARTRRAIALSLVPTCALGPLAALVSFVFLRDLAGASVELQRDVSRAAGVVLLAGLVAALGQPFRGFVYARGGARAIAVGRIVQSAVHLTVVVCGFRIFARTLLVPATGLLLATLIELFIVVRAARAIDPLVPITPVLPRDRAETMTSLREGAATLVINVSMVLALRVDVVVLARVAPLAIVAAYGVAFRAVDILYLLAKQATVALMPRLGDPSKREQAVRLGTGVFSGVIATGMAALALDGQPLLVAWVGPVADNAITATVLAILALGALILSTEELVGSMLTLGGRTAWATAVPAACGTLVNLGISVVGAPRYGVWAVAGSTVIGSLVMTSMAWRNARTLLGYGLGQIALTFAPPAVGALISLVVAWTLRGFARIHPAASLASCVIAMAAGVAASAPLLWKLSMREVAPAASAVPVPELP